jgi:hypothetical protein
VGFIDDVNLVPMLHRAVADSFSDFLDICYTPVACSIELDNINAVSGRDPPACLAVIAGFCDVGVR